MSFEKNQAKEDSKNFVLINQNKEEKDNNINNTENNLLLKPKAIKQNILNINPISNLENKYQKAPIIYPNPLQAHYINESNDKINYIKNKENEIQKNNINEKGAFSLLLNNNINNNKNNININYIKSDSNNNLQNPRIHCTCKKTKCIKKYCECFSSGNLCYNCKCENCENKPYYIENKNNIKKEEENIELDEDENEEKKLIICTCSKSGCNKNYCECFKAKVKCNNKCRCIK